MVIWHALKKRVPRPIYKSRFMQPAYFMTDGAGVLWLMDLDLATVTCLADGTPWDWDMSSPAFRKKVKALERELDGTGNPVFAPCVKAHAWHWPRWYDWQHEVNHRLVWIDVGPLRNLGWDIFPVKILTLGREFLNYPWQMRFPTCVLARLVWVWHPRGARSVLGNPGFPYQDAPPEWRPDGSRLEQYGIPRESYEWFLRGSDPIFYQLERDAEKPAGTRPLLVMVSLYMDKFRRGTVFLLCFV